MSERIYLLVCDDCNGDGRSNVEYVMFGTKEEVTQEMREEYEYRLNGPAVVFADGDVEWSDHEIDDDGAYLYVDSDKLGFDRHISWWTIEVGPKPDHGPMYVLMKGVSNDGGGITVDLLDAWSYSDAAQQVMLMEYGKELIDPSFYAGWDPDYCECDAAHAWCSVETMDMTVSFDILTSVSAAGHVNEYVSGGFDYLG